MSEIQGLSESQYAVIKGMNRPPGLSDEDWYWQYQLGREMVRDTRKEYDRAMFRPGRQQEELEARRAEVLLRKKEHAEQLAKSAEAAKSVELEQVPLGTTECADLRNVSGCCYLQLIQDQCVDGVFVKLGRFPAFVSLLGMSADVFKSFSELADYVCEEVGNGAYHVFESEKGVSFLQYALAAASVPGVSYGGGTLGCSCRRVLVRGLAGQRLYLPVVFPTDVVGGPAEMKVWLARVMEGIGEVDDVRLRLISSSAAMLSAEDKKSLRSLEALGDAAVSMLIAQDNYLCAGSAERYQNLRSRLTNNKVLSEKFVQFVPRDAVQFVGGVDPRFGVVGAKALEAVVGAVWLDVGADGVSKLLIHLGLLEAKLLA